MLIEYLPVIAMVLIAAIVAIVFLFLAKWLGARRSTYMKRTTYESGLPPFGESHPRVSIKYYMIAVSFIVFDIEVVFLYPWAVRLRENSPEAFGAMMLFIFVLFVGWLWEYKKGGLQWD
ncbi:MAG: NADH-quinone oxidoreductase subunit A [Ignavibacteria bacterium]|jgi:NADH-quinone oxidoreductase subunit A|nr:NADH-quinone oxidoreductase subunit A [Ignavibacteria bacterium]